MKVIGLFLSLLRGDCKWRPLKGGPLFSWHLCRERDIPLSSWVGTSPGLLLSHALESLQTLTSGCSRMRRGFGVDWCLNGCAGSMGGEGRIGHPSLGMKNGSKDLCVN